MHCSVAYFENLVHWRCIWLSDVLDDWRTTNCLWKMALWFQWVQSPCNWSLECNVNNICSSNSMTIHWRMNVWRTIDCLEVKLNGSIKIIPSYATDRQRVRISDIQVLSWEISACCWLLIYTSHSLLIVLWCIVDTKHYSESRHHKLIDVNMIQS